MWSGRQTHGADASGARRLGSCVRAPVLTGLSLPSGIEEEQRLLSVVKQLQLELSLLKSELSQGQHVTPSCEQVDAIHEKVRSLSSYIRFFRAKRALALMSYVH